ncbi:disease resistance protein RGH2 [Striga asiatica]|uniref:Disease resistance protein RGH2 n=1 Tax=Striga asiatica TaxID=4170 RepID=A0A5A7R6Y6_STRAF|nr:disease resistance protein RGH2 [Striga asiatica]
MAAYAALVSLVELLHPHQFPSHLQTPELDSLFSKARSLQSSLEKISHVPKNLRPTVAQLDSDIRDQIYRAQDLVESFLLDQSSTPYFLRDLTQIIETIDPLEQNASTIATSLEEDSDSYETSGGLSASPPIDSSSGTTTTKIVGQEADFKAITTKLMDESNSKLQIVSIVGLPGIGKTTLAKSIYEDPSVQSCFPTRAWVTVSQDSHVNDIFAKLLASMETAGHKAGDRAVQGNVNELSQQLHLSLFSGKYLVVVDDMWDEGVWDRVRQYLPDERNGSRIILTTRLKNIAEYANKTGFRHEMQPLSDDNSWVLLSLKAFGGGPGFDHLESRGRAIAKNCGGLPLLLIVIGGLLFQEKKTEEYWESIKEDTYAAASKGDQKTSYSEILLLSYNHLPRRLKGCFLYMGAFPEDSEILVSKIVRLWVAEEFLKPAGEKESAEQAAKRCIVDLIKRNLLSTRKETSNGHTKALGMHDSLRDVSLKQCRLEKFFHTMNRFVEKDQLPEGTGEQRRLSVHRNIFVCMKEGYDSAKSVLSTRTLIFPGPHHHHPLPYTLTFDLLRVLDALTVYFIEFPSEILQLIHLRLLSLTYNGKLPSKLSKLQKLQTLIVHRHPKIIFIGSSYLPAEIWDMPQLRHLLFMESDFPHPSECATVSNKNSVLFRNLQSLSDVNAASCTQEVLKNMPNLKKLGMWAEKPGDVNFYLDELQHLETLKFTVLNPIPNKSVNFLPRFSFPETLKRLTLSGCGIPWDEMSVIGQLPILEVLKLRELAFQGKGWAPEEGEFLALKFLLLEYVDLKYWVAEHSHFPCLESLIMRHCYKLKEIDFPDIRSIGGLKLIELVDCSPLAVEWAESLEKDNKDKKLKIRSYSSWK